MTISDTTSGATIYYTTNGTTPTTSSTQYTGPITVGSSEDKAIAAASGFANSAVGSATYTVQQGTTSTPTLLPVGGTYTAAQSVTISDATSGATIYYTTDGTPPTTSSTEYAGPITVSASETLQAIAVASGQAMSGPATAVYTINSSGGGGGAGTTVVNYPAGFTSATGFTLNGGATVAGGLQVTDGGTYENRTIWYSRRWHDLHDPEPGLDRSPGCRLGTRLPKRQIQRRGEVRHLQQLGRGGQLDRLLHQRGGSHRAGKQPDPVGGDLDSGHVVHAHLTYDGTTLTLSLTDSDQRDLHGEPSDQHCLDGGGEYGVCGVLRRDRGVGGYAESAELDLSGELRPGRRGPGARRAHPPGRCRAVASWRRCPRFEPAGDGGCSEQSPWRWPLASRHPY